jgi:predicted PurR-regulated permease PerM
LPKTVRAVRLIGSRPRALEVPGARMLAFDKQAARVTWTAALVILAGYAVYSIRRTLFVFLLAVFFSYMVYPSVRRLAALGPRRLSHTASTAIVFVAGVLLLTGIVAAIGPTVADQASALTERLPALARDPALLDKVPLPGWLDPFRGRLIQFLREHADLGTTYALPLMQQIGRVAFGVASNLVFVVLVPILAFLFVKDGTAMRRRFLAWMAVGRHGGMWRLIVDDLDSLLGRYIRALLILSLATFTVYAVAFTLAGVPYGVLLAASAALLEFIPVIGPLLAAIGCLLVAGLSGYDGLLLLIVFLGLYRLFQDYVVNPYLMSGGVAISPMWVLFGLLAGEEIGGVVGIFLSVPVLAAAKITATRILQERERGRGESSSAR